jgi:hypothetical protein
MFDPYSYFTIWSLLISYSIFIWSIFLKVPKWLFLFAACILTMTSIMGTFFITIPNANNRASKHNTTTQNVILEDAFIHSGPLILFLVLFNVISKKIVKDKPKIFKFGKFEFSLESYHKVAISLFIIVLAYYGYVNFTNIYFYDYFTLIILSGCIFATSFQIYTNLLEKI